MAVRKGLHRLCVTYADRCEPLVLDFCESCWPPSVTDVVKIGHRFKSGFRRTDVEVALDAGESEVKEGVRFGDAVPRYRCDNCRRYLSDQFSEEVIL